MQLPFKVFVHCLNGLQLKAAVKAFLCLIANHYSALEPLIFVVFKKRFLGNQFSNGPGGISWTSKADLSYEPYFGRQDSTVNMTTQASVL